MIKTRSRRREQIWSGMVSIGLFRSLSTCKLGQVNAKFGIVWRQLNERFKYTRVEFNGDNFVEVENVTFKTFDLDYKVLWHHYWGRDGRNQPRRDKVKPPDSASESYIASSSADRGYWPANDCDLYSFNLTLLRVWGLESPIDSPTISIGVATSFLLCLFVVFIWAKLYKE